MIARADIFIQNFAPGAAARAGFDPAELRQRKHKRLIVCSISGYGESGPYRDMKAYDLLIQAETGLVSLTGPPEAPGRVGVSVSDIAAGLNAHAAILEALYARERSGQGALIEVSLFDATAEWMAVPLDPFQRRQCAAARGLAPSLDRALWRLRRLRRQGDRHLHPERARMGALLRRNSGRARAWRAIRAFATIPAGSPTARALDGLVAAVFSGGSARRSSGAAQSGRDRLWQSQQRRGFRPPSAASPPRRADSRRRDHRPGAARLFCAEAPSGGVPAIGEHGAVIRKEFA